jgi:hypothetical protein
MATKITVALEDDLDGGPADETLRFAIGGTEYEIDLSKKNARNSGSGSRRSPSMPARPDHDSTAAARGHSADIRAWAKASGIPVSDRERIPASIAAQYQAASR